MSRDLRPSVFWLRQETHDRDVTCSNPVTASLINVMILHTISLQRVMVGREKLEVKSLQIMIPFWPYIDLGHRVLEVRISDDTELCKIFTKCIGLEDQNLGN